MPESDKVEKETYKQNLDTKKVRKRIRRFKTPEQLAEFLVENAPGYEWLDGVEVKKKFPNIRASAKLLNEMMEKPEFMARARELKPEITKSKSADMFNTILQKYFKGQMELDIPHYKALVVFGQISGKYDPSAKLELFDGHKMDEEKQQELNKEIVNALLNRIKREQKEEEGEPNGNK